MTKTIILRTPAAFYESVSRLLDTYPVIWRVISYGAVMEIEVTGISSTLERLKARAQ